MPKLVAHGLAPHEFDAHRDGGVPAPLPSSAPPSSSALKHLSPTWSAAAAKAAWRRLGSSTMQLETVQAQVTVPEGSVPGSTITVMVEGQQIQVVVPADAAPGIAITVSVMVKRTANYVPTRRSRSECRLTGGLGRS